MDGRSPLSVPYVTPVTRNDEWATPPSLFADWHRRLGFTVDAAASHENAKLPRFWSRAENGLSQSWAGERVWVNPPWSNVGPWVEKALTREADLTGMLLPSRTDQKWFEKLRADPVHIRFVGRVRFIDPTTQGRTSPREAAIRAVIL